MSRVPCHVSNVPSPGAEGGAAGGSTQGSGNALFEVFEPVEDDLDISQGVVLWWCNEDEMSSVRRDVVRASIEQVL